MINLLPAAEKEKLLLEKKKRIVIVLWFLVSFFLICSVLILFSIRTYIQTQVKSQQYLLLEVKKEDKQSDIQNLQEEINSINSSLRDLDSFYQNRIYFSNILEKISQILPQDVYLTNLSVFSHSKKESKGIKVSLSGFAPTTEVLFEFKQNLEKEPSFKEISFPPSNWIELTDIDFSVTFEIPQNI